MKTDYEISKENTMDSILDIASKLNIDEKLLYRYGNYIAKVDFEKINETNNNSNLILVTAITPTSAGEGKTTTTISLADSLNALEKKVCACLREPSLGPVFGLKGGACGGGYAQVQPMKDINLHFTGDIHAITCANNLICSIIDNHIYQGNKLNIDINNITFKRCLDINDRTLRDITIAQGKPTNGTTRKDSFQITVASEIMAILCLSKDLNDFKQRLSDIIVAYSCDLKPIYLKDLQIVDSIYLVLENAIKPNLVQTLEHTPVLIHGGPFANIAHGCSSIIATKLALSKADYVITEAGFGADLGCEKFLDIKCQLANLNPKAVVLVATIRALKMHGGQDINDLNSLNLNALEIGFKNLDRHIENIKKFNIEPIVSINHFYSDKQEEIKLLQNHLDSLNIKYAISKGFELGSKGSLELGKLVIDACNNSNTYKPIYDKSYTLKEKIIKVAKEIYRAKDVEFIDEALLKLDKFNNLKDYPICIAKTPSSFSDNVKLINAPDDFIFHVSDLKVSNGAKFIVVYASNILTMPGLPKIPNACKIKVDGDNVEGLF